MIDWVVRYVFQVEGLYDKIKVLSKRAHADAHKSTILSTLLLHQEKAYELEKLGPISGSGFFTVNKEVLTTMISTTLTYFIILYQM